MSDIPLENLDECQKKALEIVKNEPHRNLFIQGQAGTGKSTLIKSIKEELENQKKLYAVVAPSGIAAELIGGTTIHSLFKLGAHDYFPLNIAEKYQQYQDIVKHIDTLIIDEVSMLRADVFDTIDMLCQKAKNNGAPFGAIRVILVGDLFQLPPIYKHEKPEESRPYMKNTYGNEYPFFFEAHCYAHGNFGFTELATVHRQNGDSDFISNLRIISQGDSKDINRALEYFNQRVISGENDKEVPIVTATRNNADAENSRRLNELTGAPRIFEATIEGKYPETDYPVPQTLELKLNARVMVCKNDTNEKYVNGSMGIVAAFGNDNITILLDNGNFVTLQRTVWNKEEYVKADNGQLTSRTIGSYEQYPLKLAYAITIHKSQGQTWDKVLIDLGKTAFAPGQVYVALSRVKTLQGVHLARPLTRNDIKIDGRVRAFLNRESIAQAPVNDVPLTQESTSEVYAEINNAPNNTIHITPGAGILRVSTIYRDGTAKWTIANEDLKHDLYLQAGKREHNHNVIRIFRIKGGSYTPEQFEPNNEHRYDIKKPDRVNKHKRDIQINLGTYREVCKQDNSVDFSRHLLQTMVYEHNNIQVIINPNYDERDNNSSIIQAPIASKNPAIEQSNEEHHQPTRLEIIVNWIKNSGAYYHFSSISTWGNYKQVSRWTIKNQELEFDLYLLAGNDSDGMVYIFKIKEGTYNANDFFEHNPNRYNDNHPNIPNHEKRDIWIKLNNKEPREILQGKLFKKHLWVTINCKTGEAFRNPNYDKNDDDAYTQVPF